MHSERTHVELNKTLFCNYEYNWLRQGPSKDSGLSGWMNKGQNTPFHCIILLLYYLLIRRTNRAFHVSVLKVSILSITGTNWYVFWCNVIENKHVTDTVIASKCLTCV